MRVPFTKMHGLGNDFVVIDAVTHPVSLTPGQVRFLAERRRGVGCDQVLLVEPPARPGVDFFYRIFNADGSEAEQCGNGARCIARFIRDRGLNERRRLVVETRAGAMRLAHEADGRVTVEMGVPQFAPDAVPFETPARAEAYALEVDGDTIEVGVVSLGNPHAVVRVSDADTAPVASLGPAIEHHRRFPARANVGFMQILERTHIRLRVHERGAGETLACGSGACAAVAVGRARGWLDERVMVDLPGGRLVVIWSDIGDPVWLTGPATAVFEGWVEL
ncbi:MAG: diaminopimelate epimerase [Gammaproteobacteria bacterium]|nr:diaminopimelate epimerase [Gammaproteobacteria bacterium]